ncbi:MAG: L,D-transpeptidase family protein [Algiphilus sp.]
MPLPRLTVSLAAQRLTWSDGAQQQSWPVSTATVGANERNGSGGTPRGRHRIRARIGDGAHPHAVFIGRRPTGEVWTPELAVTAPHRDWILGRIPWLCGCEPGRNRFGAVDTMRRYIYIHGTPPDQPLGVPGSHGCIRMACDDVVALFDCTPAGSEVWIDD